MVLVIKVYNRGINKKTTKTWKQVSFKTEADVRVNDLDIFDPKNN